MFDKFLFLEKKHKTLLIYIYEKIFSVSDFNEFKNLVISANIKSFDYLKIRIRKPNVNFYIGYGNIKKIKNNIKIFKYSLLIINIVLKNNQERNLIKFLKCKFLDRTNLIINIFRNRVKTIFGKLQVELAYLNYLSTRLVRNWSHLERQRGGNKNISGPGEKQIEIDRRLLRKKIKSIKLSLSKISFQKEKNNELRNKNKLPLISIVGYTNSGKSTLFNILTKSDVIVKNSFFSTLDTYIRKIKLFNLKKEILLSDTIGFIRNLPKNIQIAFNATLREIKNSSIIFHVIDISDVYFNEYINVVNKTLDLINVKNIPIIQIMNKIDKIKSCKEKIEFNYYNEPYRIWISSKYGFGLNLLKKVIINFLFLKKKIYYFRVYLNEYLIVINYLYRNNFIKKEFSYNGFIYFLNLFLSDIEIYYLLKKYKFLKYCFFVKKK